MSTLRHFHRANDDWPGDLGRYCTICGQTHMLDFNSSMCIVCRKMQREERTCFDQGKLCNRKSATRLCCIASQKFCPCGFWYLRLGNTRKHMSPLVSIHWDSYDIWFPSCQTFRVSIVGQPWYVPFFHRPRDSRSIKALEAAFASEEPLFLQQDMVSINGGTP